MNEELARRAKERAARNGRSFTQLVEEAVNEYLATPNNTRRRKKIVLPTAGDPHRRITQEEYRAAVEQMHDEEAEFIRRGCR